MDDRAAIEAAIAAFVRGYASGDLEGVLAYYDADLIKLRQGAASESKEDVSRRVEEVFREHDTRVDVVNDEVAVSGNMAYTRGSYRVTLRPRAGGEIITVDRRYLEIWRKRDGRWVVFRTMDNTA